MGKAVRIGDRLVGDGEPVFVIAEIGLNHNGSLDIARQLIDVAADAGCDAVKFQKRTPELCTPPEMRDKRRETPWGEMSYIDYRERIEFWRDEYAEIDKHCRKRGIQWFASAFDIASLDFLLACGVPCIKIPSCCLTDRELLRAARASGVPVMLSTGMSNLNQVIAAATVLDRGRLLLAHCTSTYPCPPEELNLRCIESLKLLNFGPVGYSGHEVGLATTLAAVALGATFIERHITLDRSMWGSDQAASVEPQGLKRLVADIRTIEQALGDGVKRVYDSEKAAAARLRFKDTLGV